MLKRNTNDGLSNRHIPNVFGSACFGEDSGTIALWWWEDRLTHFWTVTSLPAQSLQSWLTLCGPMGHSPQAPLST